MICPSCSFNNPGGMRFCGNCGTRLPGTQPLPARPVRPFVEAPGDRLHEWMDAERRERLRSAGLEAAGQRRNVTVLFADLSGYTAMSERLDTEDVYGMINQFLGILVEAVYKYEGTLDKITGDGIMALFGAPQAFENNAERAARAALEMQAEVQRFAQEMLSRLGVEPRMRIGLHSGDVVVGGVGSDLFMQYTAIGDTVNLARRLEEAAPPGSIFVSHSVVRTTDPVLDFEPLRELRLKGIDEPVTAYRLMGVKSKPGAVRGVEGLSAPMIGREGELGRLRDAARALTESERGQTAVVTGEAGIGKSRLTRELKRLIAPLPVRIFEGSSLSYRRSISYWSFNQILRAFFGVAADSPEAELRPRIAAALRAHLPDRAEDLQPYLEQLLGLRPAPGPAAQHMASLEPGQVRQKTFIAIRDLLHAEARRLPIVLIFEDLHWVDGASQDLLLYLLDHIDAAPILYYCISRPAEGQALPEILRRMEERHPDRLVRIALTSLSIEQTEQLTRELLTLPQLPREFREHILLRAAGNPFYLEELLRTLIDRQIIHRSGEGWAIAPGAALADHTVPDSLQGLILARFDRLAENDRRALQVASVIGHEFTFELLQHVLESEPQLPEVLAALHGGGFVVPADGDGSLARGYHFMHVLTAETVYGTLLKRDRDTLHGRVAQTIERLYAHRLEEFVEMLAHHYDRSGEAEKALHFLLLAGEKSFRAFAIPEARVHFERARELLIRVPYHPDQKHRLLFHLGDIQTYAGEYDRARETYQEGIEAVPRVDATLYAERAGGLLRRIGVTFEKQGGYAQALARYEEARQLVEAAPRRLPESLARILNDTGWVHFQQGNLEEARACLQRALALAEGGGNAEIISSIYNRLGGVSFARGDLDEAAEHVRKSLVLRERFGDLTGAARSFVNLGVLADLRGHWDQAVENYRRSLELQERIGDMEGIAYALGNLGVIYMNQGQFQSAQHALARNLELARRIQHKYMQALAQANLGALAIEQGRSESGQPLLEEALQLFEGLNDQENLIYTTCLLGEVRLQTGRRDEARALAHRALALCEQAPAEEMARSRERVRALRLMAAVQREDGDLEASLGILRECMGILEQLRTPLEHVKCLHEMAVTQLAKGARDEALSAATEAHHMAMRLGAGGERPRLEALMNRISNSA